MNKSITSIMLLAGLLLAAAAAFSTVAMAQTPKPLAREIELRQGADDAPDLNEDAGERRGRGADDAVDVNDDHGGRGRGGDDLARREDRRDDRRGDRTKEVEVEVEKLG